MQGIGASSAQQAVGQHHGQQTTNLPAANSAFGQVGTDDLCGTEPTAMTRVQVGEAVERALAAIEKQLTIWQYDGSPARLVLVRGHVDQLIALTRLHQRSSP